MKGMITQNKRNNFFITQTLNNSNMETNKIEQAAKMHADNAGYFHSAYVYECGFISGVKWIKTADGDDPLLEENKRLKDALHTILNNYKANKNFGTTLNNQEIDAGISIMERTLNHSTVKEVGDNG